LYFFQVALFSSSVSKQNSSPSSVWKQNLGGASSVGGGGLGRGGGALGRGGVGGLGGLGRGGGALGRGGVGGLGGLGRGGVGGLWRGGGGLGMERCGASRWIILFKSKFSLIKSRRMSKCIFSSLLDLRTSS